jgi:putative glutamine amidotransferase
MYPPLIGITVSRPETPDGNKNLSISEAYVRSIESVGACPILIPLGISAESLKSIIRQLDGILFSGGGDIHPECYGGEMHPMVNRVDRDRDRVELDAIDQALSLGLPIMGICRGIQLINVAFGGSLYEDLTGQKPGAIQHDYSSEMPRHYLAHPIQVTPGSKLAEITKKPELKVNSMHHQGIKDLGRGLQVNADALDGLIEAFEITGYPFGMAVQWHPECLPDKPEMVKLFQAFIDAARR